MSEKQPLADENLVIVIDESPGDNTIRPSGPETLRDWLRPQASPTQLLPLTETREVVVKRFKPGTKLEMLARHQSNKKFAPVRVVGEILEGTEEHDYKMKVRVYGDWRPQKGHVHKLLRVSDSIWLTYIGIPKNADGSTNLPDVLEILRELPDDEFEKIRAGLTDE